MLDPDTLLRTTYSLNAPTTAEALWTMGRVYGSQPRTELIDGNADHQADSNIAGVDSLDILIPSSGHSSLSR